jgi:predicted lipoprotein with Yx(FWY)xxD motif
MKFRTSTVALVVLIACCGFAATPWKMMATAEGEGYSDARDIALSSFDSDGQNGANCYGACAATAEVAGVAPAREPLARETNAPPSPFQAR